MTSNCPTRSSHSPYKSDLWNPWMQTPLTWKPSPPHPLTTSVHPLFTVVHVNMQSTTIDNEKDSKNYLDQESQLRLGVFRALHRQCLYVHHEELGLPWSKITSPTRRNSSRLLPCCIPPTIGRSTLHTWRCMSITNPRIGFSLIQKDGS